MIRGNVEQILSSLPAEVQLVGAAKTRTPGDILEAVEAGLRIVGENYVQEAEKAFSVVGSRVSWHMIGHLQSNKAKKAARIFDMVETVDSAKLARTLDKACRNLQKTMSILIEVNSGEEQNKTGVMPSEVLALIREISPLPSIRVMGLMTMGPFMGDPEDARPYFRKTRILFEEIKHARIPEVDMRYLSMGMSNSYQVAIEEGANMVRIGTRLFGKRDTR